MTSKVWWLLEFYTWQHLRSYQDMYRLLLVKTHYNLLVLHTGKQVHQHQELTHVIQPQGEAVCALSQLS